MIVFYDSVNGVPETVADAVIESEQVDEYASSFIEPVVYGWNTTLKKVLAQVNNALLTLSCLKLKGKNKWGLEGVVKSLKTAKVFGGVA